MLLRGHNHNLSNKINRYIASAFFALLPLFAVALIVYVLHAGFGTDLKPVEAAVGVNKMISYQAKMTDAAGVTVPDGTYHVTLRIYDSASGGTCLYTASGTSCGTATSTPVTVTNGILSVMIGDTASQNALTLDFNSDTYYLGVQVGNDSEMTPRKRIGAAGYAINSDTLDGYNTSLTGGSTSFVPVTNSAGDLFLTQRYLTSSTIYASGSGTSTLSYGATFATEGGNVGIGTASTAALLHVKGVSNQTQVIIQGASGQTAANPLMLFRDSSGNDLMSVTTDNWNNVFMGRYAGENNAYSFPAGAMNTFVGSGAGEENTSGRNNSAFGSAALRWNTSGSYNTAVGEEAMANMNGSNNVAVGQSALSFNSGLGNTASNNTAIGSGAANLYAVGNDNVFVGTNALYRGTGENNVIVGSRAANNVNAATNTVAIGYFSGYGSVSVTNLYNETMLGYQTGYSLTAGVNNILFGYKAGDELTIGSGNILIGYDIDAPAGSSSSGTLSIGNLIYGTNLDGTGTTISSGNVGISTSSPIAKFTVANGSVLFDGTTGATPVSGEGTRLMWIPAKGAFRAGYINGTQWNDAYIGSYSVATGYNTTASGTYSTAMGYLTVASGNYSMAMGYDNDATGPESTAMGYSTTASGAASTALGGITVASGNNSIAMGAGSVASGYVSTAMGNYTDASGDYATAMGSRTDASGDVSVALGSYTTASGLYSIAMGFFASSTAENSVVIGSGSDWNVPLVNSTANSLAVGFNSTVPTLMVTGGTGAGTYGKVGIGNTAPGELLTIGLGNIALGDGSTTTTLGFATSTYIYAHPLSDTAGYSAFTINTTSTVSKADVFTVRNNGTALLSVANATTTFGSTYLLPSQTTTTSLGKINIDSTFDLTLDSASPGNNMSPYIKPIGDINGDGYDDLVVGAQSMDGGGSTKGQTFIYYGGPNADGTIDMTFTGEGNYNYFGISADGGDVNGDGYPDIIIGATGYNSNRGKAYLYFGGPGMDTTAELTFTGVSANDFLGRSVAFIGDVNGDGYGDIAMGADGYSSNEKGQAYIYFGGPNMDNVADITITGTSYDYLGGTISPAGDVNGDGYPDVIVGAWGAQEAYIYFGGPNIDNVADITLSAPAGGSFGNSVSGAGDVNGDGYADVVVGAPFAAGGGSARGEAYVYYGGKNMDSTADVTINGVADSDNLGYKPSKKAGDVNGDGYDDIIIGIANEKKAYIFYGGATMNNVVDIILDNQNNYDFGYDASSAGDFNADGYNDIVAGDSYYVYLYTSAPVAWSTVISQAVYSPLGLSTADTRYLNQKIQSNYFEINAQNWGISRTGTSTFTGLTVSGNTTSTFFGSLAVGTSTASIPAKFSVDGSVLFQGNSGATPVSGAGTRLMWIPSKSAFRAGGVDPDITWGWSATTVGNEWDESNIGSYSSAMGLSTKASGDFSAAIGMANIASGFGAMAFGVSSTASGNDSVAMGYNALAGGGYNIAIGREALAINQDSVALGAYATANGSAAAAVGYQVTASGPQSAAFGRQSLASGTGAISIGTNSVASNYESMAFGDQLISSGNISTAMGTYTEASGDYSFVLGAFASSTATNSFTIGYGTAIPTPLVNSTANSLAVGFNSTVPTLMVTGASGAGTTGEVLIATSTDALVAALPNWTSKLLVDSGDALIGETIYQQNRPSYGLVITNPNLSRTVIFSTASTSEAGAGIENNINYSLDSNEVRRGYKTTVHNDGSVRQGYTLEMRGFDADMMNDGTSQINTIVGLNVRIDHKNSGMASTTYGQQISIGTQDSAISDVTYGSYITANNTSSVSSTAIYGVFANAGGNPSLTGMGKAYGGYFQAGNASTTYGIYASAVAGDPGNIAYAGWFGGDIYVDNGAGTSTISGNLAVGQKVTQNCGTGCIDIAEKFDSSESVEPGDVVSIANNQLPITNDVVVEKTKVGYAHNIVGIVSTNPAITMNGDTTVIGTDGVSETMTPPVALAGRVPVKVTDENGPVKAGDLLVSSSSTPGAAMRYNPNADFRMQNAELPAVIGMALTNFDVANNQTGLEPEKNKEFQIEIYSLAGEAGLQTVHQGKVLTLIKNNYVQPSGISTDGVGLTLSEDGKIISTRDIDMGNNSLLNVKSVTSASGNWSIDENGYLIAKKVTAEEYEIDARKKGEADATLGRATVPVGMNEILVNNNRVKKNSNIVITFYGNPGGTWWISNQEDGWFKVTLSTGTGSEIGFRYWVQSVIEDEINPVSIPTPAAAPEIIESATAAEPIVEIPVEEIIIPTSTPPALQSLGGGGETATSTP